MIFHLKAFCPLQRLLRCEACVLLSRSSIKLLSRNSHSLLRVFCPSCALFWIPAYPWQLTYALRREILTIFVVLVTPSAVHLHIGATVGLSASPALCEFLDTRYFRFIGLKCCMLLCLSYSAPFENTSRNSIGRHAIFLWQVEGSKSRRVRKTQLLLIRMFLPMNCLMKYLF